MAGYYDERIAGARQQAETARKLREAALPQGQMVSGIYVAPAWTQYLAEGLRGYQARQQEEEAKALQAQLESQKASEVSDIQRQLGNAPQVQFAPGAYDSLMSGNINLGQPLTQTTTAQPTQQQRMAALLRGVSVAPEQFAPQLAAEQWMQGQEEKRAAREEAADLRREQMRMQLLLRPEKMVTVMDHAGNPMTVPQSQMGGMTLYSPAASKQVQEQSKKEAGRQALSQDLQDLAETYRQLKAGGGAVSTERGALSNIGTRIAGSGLGQIVGGALGTENQALRDSLEAKRPMLMQAIKDATGMTAAQMNSDADIKLMMKTTSDPNASFEANMAILDKLDKKFGLGLGISQPGESIMNLNQTPQAGGATFLGFE